VALTAGGPSGSARLSQDFLFGVVNDILRIAGHRDIEDMPSWRTWAQQRLDTNRATPKSQDNYRHYVDTLSKWLGKQADSPITSITHEALQRWYDEQIKAGLLKRSTARATPARLLANAGMPIDIRRLITGHAGDDMNLVYTHLENETKVTALAKAVGQIT
jgi:hypothetical protein